MADYSDLMKLEKKAKPPLPSVTSSHPSVPLEAPTSTSLLANQQTSKEVNQQTDLSVSQLASKPANQQTNKQASQQTGKLLKKFGSYLREDSIKSLKKIAFMTERKDYEVLQEAVDFFLEHKK